MFVNLLPQSTRLKIQFRRMLRCYAVIWAVVGLGFAAYAAVEMSQLWEAKRELAVLEGRCQPVYALQQAISSDQQQLKHVQSQLVRLKELQPSNHFIDLLGVLVQATRSESGHLHIQRLSLLSGQTALSPSGSAASGKQAKSQSTISTLSLSGIADDDAAVTRFVTALRSVGVFEQVDLKASSQVAGNDGAARQYQLECRYEDAP